MEFWVWRIAIPEKVDSLYRVELPYLYCFLLSSKLELSRGCHSSETGARKINKFGLKNWWCENYFLELPIVLLVGTRNGVQALDFLSWWFLAPLVLNFTCNFGVGRCIQQLLIYGIATLLHWESLLSGGAIGGDICINIDLSSSWL